MKPSQAKRKLAAKPKTTSKSPEPLRVIGIQDLSNRLQELERKHEQLARYVQNTREMLQGGDNTLRDRIDKIESTIGDMIDETMPERPAPRATNGGESVNERYLSGRWLRGETFAPMGNSNDQGSSGAPPASRRAIRKGRRGASQGV